jgi:NTE family protein
MAAEYYEKLLFEGKTLGDLYSRDGPRIEITATDIISGLNFRFSPYLFALTCMDFDSFPVARAVAASAAFPGPFTPIVLRNYAGTCGAEEEPWVTRALETKNSADRAYGVAQKYHTYADPAGKPYIHLLDGGIADNLGLRGAMELLNARGARTLQDLGLENTRRVLVIVVDAASKTEHQWGPAGKVPGLKGILSATSSVMMASINHDTLYLAHSFNREWAAEYSRRYPQRPVLTARIAHLKFADLEDEAERKHFHSIPTAFHLPAKTVDELREVAGRLLFQNKDFQAFLRDVDGHLPD